MKFTRQQLKQVITEQIEEMAAKPKDSLDPEVQAIVNQIKLAVKNKKVNEKALKSFLELYKVSDFSKEDLMLKSLGYSIVYSKADRVRYAKKTPYYDISIDASKNFWSVDVQLSESLLPPEDPEEEDTSERPYGIGKTLQVAIQKLLRSRGYGDLGYLSPKAAKQLVKDLPKV